MENKNQTWGSYFIINGITDLPSVQAPIFVLVLLIYLSILFGNTTILTLIFSDTKLHTPMYFFLGNLSFLDICYTTVTMHKILLTYTSGDKTVSFAGCLTQMYFYVAFLCSEYILLAAMAYDRYAAVCHPLRYQNLMSLERCSRLAMMSWGFGLLESIIFLGLISQYSFCRSNVINHLFCDLKPLIKLTCSNTNDIELVIQISAVVFGVFPLVFILVSYILIVSAILRIRSKEGKRKAFSTCSSHLTVVILFFGIILSMYMRPKSAYSIEQDKVLAILYALCIPTLNPFIYSLRNKEVKNALWKLKGSILGDK
uniref:Olfactory receptor n=1 Tax=Leptobrachium leishanense TaxID=445787 RepID=A0A8C5QYU5_9ANUR